MDLFPRTWHGNLSLDEDRISHSTLSHWHKSIIIFYGKVISENHKTLLYMTHIAFCLCSDEAGCVLGKENTRNLKNLLALMILLWILRHISSFTIRIFYKLKSSSMTFSRPFPQSEGDTHLKRMHDEHQRTLYLAQSFLGKTTYSYSYVFHQRCQRCVKSCNHLNCNASLHIIVACFKRIFNRDRKTKANKHTRARITKGNKEKCWECMKRMLQSGSLTHFLS